MGEVRASIAEHHVCQLTCRIRRDDGSYNWTGDTGKSYAVGEWDRTVLCILCGSGCAEGCRTGQEEAYRMYEAAVEEGKLVVWEYDIPNRRIVMAQNEFTAYDYREIWFAAKY